MPRAHYFAVLTSIEWRGARRPSSVTAVRAGSALSKIGSSGARLRFVMLTQIMILINYSLSCRCLDAQNAVAPLRPRADRAVHPRDQQIFLRSATPSESRASLGRRRARTQWNACSRSPPATPYFSRACTFCSPAIAYCSSFSEPLAPPTPITPTTSSLTLISTAPARAR